MLEVSSLEVGSLIVQIVFNDYVLFYAGPYEDLTGLLSRKLPKSPGTNLSLSLLGTYSVHSIYNHRQNHTCRYYH